MFGVRWTEGVSGSALLRVSTSPNAPPSARLTLRSVCLLDLTLFSPRPKFEGRLILNPPALFSFIVVYLGPLKQFLRLDRGCLYYLLYLLNSL